MEKFYELTDTFTAWRLEPPNCTDNSRFAKFVFDGNLSMGRAKIDEKRGKLYAVLLDKQRACSITYFSFGRSDLLNHMYQK